MRFRARYSLITCFRSFFHFYNLSFNRLIPRIFLHRFIPHFSTALMAHCSAFHFTDAASPLAVSQFLSLSSYSPSYSRMIQESNFTVAIAMHWIVSWWTPTVRIAGQELVSAYPHRGRIVTFPAASSVWRTSISSMVSWQGIGNALSGSLSISFVVLAGLAFPLVEWCEPTSLYSSPGYSTSYFGLGVSSKLLASPWISSRLVWCGLARSFCSGKYASLGTLFRLFSSPALMLSDILQFHVRKLVSSYLF